MVIAVHPSAPRRVVRPPLDPPTQYATDVVAGKIVAGHLVRLACQRHLDDLRNGRRRGLIWKPDLAQHALDFFGFLHHYKGEWAGSVIRLEPWQQFIIGSAFGWYRADGTRRFRLIYTEVARKNGKSTIAAGIGLYLAFFDGEQGAEVYAAATKRDQAKIIWGDARRMVLASTGLKRRITPFVGNLHDTRSNSKFEPLGADSDSMDGLNVHGAIIDELHAHKTREVWDVLETASGSRRQPMRWVITTAGTARESIWGELRADALRVLEGTPDDSQFVYIATLDEGDDPFDEKIWPKANPNLGVSVKVDDLREQATRAGRVPGRLNAFMRLRLNVPTQASSRWLSRAVWDANAAPPASAPGAAGYAGLDLASVRDLTAFLLLLPADDGVLDVLARFWCPQEGIDERSRRDGVPYADWAREGFLIATEGNVTDYDVVREGIRELAEEYQIEEIAYDRWNATQLITQLTGDGATCVPIGQGFGELTAPSKELEKLLLDGELRHGGHPILAWMADHVEVEEDAYGNIRPSKRRSAERIDGIVALVMAVKRWQVHGDTEPVMPSVW